ncbi:MAG: type I DNA topoisomerase [Bacteroidetes bacterium]|nr:type I DNA topoisomerase [Bacteroidota bacterium]
MAQNLVIVESPAKAKTIEKYLGSAFTVRSSFGHIRDLPERGIGIDVAKGFTPEYIVSEDKKDVVAQLRKLAKSADTVWLASDEDREGEAISWHLAEALDLDVAKTKRIVFHEITKTAILKAVDHPRHIDMNLVNAQQARRVLDRLVGFELSPVLWKKVRRGLSAGRVQSVAVRMIVERERAIEQFVSDIDFRMEGRFTAPNGAGFAAEYHGELRDQAAVDALAAALNLGGFRVSSLEQKTAPRKPAAPFTTSTLQQEASRKIGMAVSRTMSLAQKLYENGHITYMRTDSVNLSDEAVNGARHAITELYGASFAQTRRYTTKSAGAQEAHEAIRPTNMLVKSAGNDAAEKKLYELIWKRTLASQMADAQIDRTVAHLSNSAAEFIARGEMISFEGFLKVYREGVDEEEDEAGMLPPLKQGDGVQLASATATQRFTRPPGRFTEATLVKALEEEGIGRPSTYAPTISTIQNRGYVAKGVREGEVRHVAFAEWTGGSQWNWTQREEKFGSDKGRLVPTDIGNLVTDYLVAHFGGVMDYSFTAKMEAQFDEVAEGRAEWQQVLADFYSKFHPLVTESEESERVRSVRVLGTHPESGRQVSARLAKFGPVVMLGGGDGDEADAKFVGIPEPYTLDKISLPEALELLRLPRLVGTYEGKPLRANFGRFGPYIQWDKTFASITPPATPLNVTEAEAIAFVESKLADAQASLLKTFSTPDGEVELRKGRFGPYLKWGKENVKIPRGTEPESLTADDVHELISKHQPSTGGAKGRGRGAAKSKNTAKSSARKTK